VLVCAIGIVYPFLNLAGETACAETNIVPMVTVSERYDTNVLFINPKAAPGVDVEDLVTTISPQLVMRSRGGPVEVNGVIGAVGEVYKNNPGLNYVGLNTSLGLGLTPIVSRVLQNASLNVFGSYQYTPQPPAFLSSHQDPQNQDPFLRGIQAFRTNTTIYSVGETIGYRFTPSVLLQSNYNYSKMSFGTGQVQVAGTGLLDQEAHQFGLSPSAQLSRIDTVSNNYALSAYKQVGLGSFRTHTDTIGWRRMWSPSLASQINAGAQYIESINTTIGTQSFSQAAVVVPAATIAVTYSSRTEVIGDLVDSTGQLSGLKQLAGSYFPGGIGSVGSNSIRLRYNYGVYPLFVAGGGLAKSHLVGLDGTVSLTSKLSASYGASFARNVATGTSNFSFESIAGNAGLAYLVTPALRATLNYSYMNAYGIGAQDSATINALAYARQVVMLSLTYAFGGGSQLFQGGGYFGGTMGGAGSASSGR
jgi:hypothetical protein